MQGQQPKKQKLSKKDRKIQKLELLLAHTIWLMKEAAVEYWELEEKYQEQKVKTIQAKERALKFERQSAIKERAEVHAHNRKVQADANKLLKRYNALEESTGLQLTDEEISTYTELN